MHQETDLKPRASELAPSASRELDTIDQYLQREINAAHILIQDAVLNDVFPLEKLREAPVLPPSWNRDQEEKVLRFFREDRHALVALVLRKNKGLPKFDAEELVENSVLRMTDKTRRAIAARLPKLSKDTRRAFVMKVFLDYSQADVFGLTGVPGYITGRLKNEFFDLIEPGLRNKHYMDDMKQLYSSWIDNDENGERERTQAEISPEDNILAELLITAVRSNGRNFLVDEPSDEKVIERFKQLNERQRRFMEQRLIYQDSVRDIAHREGVTVFVVYEVLKRAEKILKGEITPGRKKKKERPFSKQQERALIAKAVLTDEDLELPKGLDRENLRNVYSHLTPLSRRIIEMRYLEKMSAQDIADRLGRKISFVQFHLLRSFRDLKSGELKNKNTHRGENQRVGEKLATALFEGKVGRGFPDNLSIHQLKENSERLTAPQREIFVMVCLQKKSIKVASAALGITYPSASYLLNRAIKILLGKEKPVERKIKEVKEKKPDVNMQITEVLLCGESHPLPEGLTRKILMERYQLLTEKQKKALEKRYKEKMSIEEIAQLTGQSISNLYTTLRKSLKILRGEVVPTRIARKEGEKVKKKKIRGTVYCRNRMRVRRLFSGRYPVDSQIYQNFLMLSEDEKSCLRKRFIEEKSIETIASEENYSESRIHKKLTTIIREVGLEVRKYRKTEKDVKQPGEVVVFSMSENRF